MMDSGFIRSLEEVLRDFGKGEARERKPPKTSPETDAENAATRRRLWFADYAEKRVLPLLHQTVATVQKHGGVAQCQLRDGAGTLRATLEIVPPHLPVGARPPRLTIAAAQGERSLAVDHTGTFPHVGATGGFGAEIEYNAIYPSQLEDAILGFVALATSA